MWIWVTFLGMGIWIALFRLWLWVIFFGMGIWIAFFELWLWVTFIGMGIWIVFFKLWLLVTFSRLITVCVPFFRMIWICVPFFRLMWIWPTFSRLLWTSDVFLTDMNMIDFFQALQYLNDITNDQVLTINPTFRLPDSTGLFAHMFVNGIHLNQDLIDRGFATPKPVSFSSVCLEPCNLEISDTFLDWAET